MIGEMLGSYRVVEQIGLGGMARVYKAYDAATDRYVALKTLDPHYSNDPRFLERFKREAKAIARLEHPHILPIYTYGEENGTAYLSMRYLRGGTLKEQIQGSPLSLDQAAIFLAQIADALDYAHENHILHRDVKPSNVLLDEKGNTFLSDFGIAKIIEPSVELTGAGILGTPAYMSPEQCRGVRDLTPNCDQYSLGIVLYEMVTGRTPFEAETPMALVYMQLNDPLPLPRSLRPDLTEETQNVILKALAKDPIDRWPSCGALSAAFNRALADHSSAAPREIAAITPDDHKAVRDKAGPSIPRWALGILFLIAVGVLGAAGLALGLFGKPTPIADAPSQAAGANSTLFPAPTTLTLVASDTILVDDFSDPAYEGLLNPAKWAVSPDCQKDVFQQNGVLTGLDAGDRGSCALELANPASATLEELGVFEAQMQVASGFQGDADFQSIMFVTRDLPGEFWFAECGLKGDGNGGLASFFVIQNYADRAQDYNAIEKPALPDTWYTYRLIAQPDSATFSCMLNGELIGSVARTSEAAALRDTHFQRLLQTWRWSTRETTRGTAISYADNVRVFPGSEGRAAAQSAAVLIPSDPTLYDDFSDPAYDGAFNGGLWSASQGPTWTQIDGALKVNQRGAEQEGYCNTLNLTKYANYTLNTPLFFQSDVLLSAEQSLGDLSIMVNGFRQEDLPSTEETHCGIRRDVGMPQPELYCFNRWNMQSNTVSHSFDDHYSTPSQSTTVASNHTVRVEIDPTSMMFRYYIDGQKVGEHVPTRAEQLKDAVFTFRLNVCSLSTTDDVTGYLDNIRIGAIAP